MVFLFLPERAAGLAAGDPAPGPAAGTEPGSQTARGARMRPDEREVRLVSNWGGGMGWRGGEGGGGEAGG